MRVSADEEVDFKILPLIMNVCNKYLMRAEYVLRTMLSLEIPEYPGEPLLQCWPVMVRNYSACD